MRTERPPRPAAPAGVRLATPDPWAEASRAAEDRAKALAASLRAIGARFSVPRIIEHTKTSEQCPTPSTTNT